MAEQDMDRSLFDEVFDLPDPRRQLQFESLVGLDTLKARLVKEGRLLLSPGLLDDWSQKHYGKLLPAVFGFHNRPPLLLFAGDVGTGKTTMAETFGDEIARQHGIRVRVAKVSLKTRGSGAVGEMTQLMSKAFTEMTRYIQENLGDVKKPVLAGVLIIDEADALTQSRDFAMMSHEDRAGVNSIVRGIDIVTGRNLPLLVVLCTNRVKAIDPAIMRRVAVRHEFNRPAPEQRAAVFKMAFGDALSAKEIEMLVSMTAAGGTEEYGYTFSDITQRIIPMALLDAFPDKPVTFNVVSAVVQKVRPTMPFEEGRTTR